MTPEYTPAQEKAFDAFTQSIFDDLDGKDRWPDHARFIPADSENAAKDAFKSLRDGQSAILVSAEGVAICLSPAPVNPVHNFLLKLFARALVDVTESDAEAHKVKIRATISENSLLSVH